ncbi:MAG: hypothetical protein GX318_05905 [Clostridia bacterium]|nr:hypothetical protein [Clostridia bacterium]
MAAACYILASQHMDYLYNKLRRNFNLLCQRCGEVECQLVESKDYSLISCVIIKEGTEDKKPTNNLPDIYKKCIADTVSDVIVERFQKDLIEKIFSNHHSYLDEAIKDKLYKNMGEITDYNEGSHYMKKGDKELKSMISHRLIAHLNTNNRINIEGFIKFALKDYSNKLKIKIDDAVDEYLLEKEYDDFIDLLRCFVEIQEPRVDKVHVIIRSTSVFELFDDDYNVIDNEYLENFILEMVDSELSYEDLLISALITIAPLEVKVHLPDYNGFCDSLATIQKVFEQRVSLCTGCSKCIQLEHRKF